MKTKFTSGEWVARKSRTGVTTIQHNEQGFLIATIAGIDEKLANAKLIAAAPDMIKKLMHTYLCLQIMSRNSVAFAVETDFLRAGLRNAISEALGIGGEEVQSWCEGASMDYKKHNGWEAIKKATT